MFKLSANAAGVILALTAVASVAQPQATLENLPALRMIEEQRIGHATDPNIGFSRIQAMAVDRDGQIFVFESRDFNIRVYSRDGMFLRTISRRGTGPGEFSTPGVLMGVVGDTVWTLMNAASCGWRIALFKRSGELLSTTLAATTQMSLHGTGVYGTVAPAIMRADGKFVGHLSCTFSGRSLAQTVVPLTDTIRLPRTLFSATGAILDTLGWDYRLPVTRFDPVAITIEGRRHTLPSPPADAAIDERVHDGTFTVERKTPQSAAQSTLRVTRTSLAGDTVWSQTWVVRYRITGSR